MRRSGACVRPVAYVLAFAIAYVGCDNSFSPKSEFHPQLVVYCVLNALTEPPVVVVEKSYDASISVHPVPLTEKEVLEADVRITEGTRTYVAVDTTVLSGSSTRRVWVFRNLKTTPGASPHLSVTVPGLPSVSADLRVPSRFHVRGSAYSFDPSNPDSTSLVLKSELSDDVNPPYAYYYRLWITGEKVKDGRRDTLRIEVPIHHLDDGTALYSFPSRSEERKFPFDEIKQANVALFQNDTTVENKLLILACYGMEQHFYGYYKVVRGFDDPTTVRIDSPNVSYITGGLGVFGAFLVDSVKYNYYTYIRK
jgi:hypothetical protein